MIRKIIRIDRSACTGCGLCAAACHEGAIAMVNGKAELLRDDYCDGLGDCLPACPAGAITFVEREAAAYDEKAVQAHKKAAGQPAAVIDGPSACVTGTAAAATGVVPGTARQPGVPLAAPAEQLPCGCPGTQSKTISRRPADAENSVSPCSAAPDMCVSSQLCQWPVQIKLVPPAAPYFDGAHLLIAADCTAYAYGSFHRDFIKGKITLIGCPKLDAVDYTEKLTEIIRSNDIKIVTVVRMEVPCCGGIQSAAVSALKASGKFIPWQVVTISTDGTILPD